MSGFSASSDYISRTINGAGLIHSELKRKFSFRLSSSPKTLTVHFD
jgi:hypothetical protein